MRTRPTSRLLPALAAGLLAGPALAAPEAPMTGFAPAGARAERAAEARFDAALSEAAIQDRLKIMASAPNQVGSPHDRANAEFVLSLFRAWGFDARIETFQVLYPTPRTESLELLGPHGFRAGLTEPPVAGDATSAIREGALPPYAVYGADGDVTAPVVYVNYGMPEDYAALARAGVDVAGKIVLARYGGGWRGLKPKLAAEHGAVGCLIYSDPAEDGYGSDDPYPKGAARPADGVQRGSVLDMPIEAGDPLTPGVGADESAIRVSMRSARTLMRIPTLPISYADAQPLLAAMGGPIAPHGFRGALPLAYHVGPTADPVHLVVQSDWSLRPLYDVIAVARGSELPDSWIIRANHRDGWVFGAWDPLSGQTEMLEEAKGVGALLATGWRPRRTIVFASWDGEEPGLLGSTEWVEAHAPELDAKAALYVNTDASGRGFLKTAGSYALRALVDESAGEVTDPETGVSVRARSLAKLAVEGGEPEASPAQRSTAKAAADGGALPIAALGSGSDFTPFSQHLGIASVNLEFEGEDRQNGIYHSQYDTYEHFVRFGDPGFHYEKALAQTAGRLVLRAADADALPYDFQSEAAGLAADLADLQGEIDGRRVDALYRNRLLDARAFALASDPSNPTAPPPRAEPPPAISLAPMADAIARLRQAASDYAAAGDGLGRLSAGERAALDETLKRFERALTDARGLPGRPWYRHLISAPGLLTGYGAKTYPGVREAIEAGRWPEAQDFVGRTAAAIDAAASSVDKASEILRRAKRPEG